MISKCSVEDCIDNVKSIYILNFPKFEDVLVNI